MLEEALVIGTVLDDGISNSGHLGGDRSQCFALAIRIEGRGAQIAFVLIAKGILPLMNRNQASDPEGKAQPLVAAFGQHLASLALAGLALGEIQSTVLEKLAMMTESA